MSTPVSISVVTIVYNGAAYIERAINTVLSQNYANLEYIVIDGGSTDGTLEILKRYHNRIDKIISEPDAGISDAFNKGIDLATGEVIGILNADDQYFPETLRSLAAVYSTEGVYYGNMQLLSNSQPGKTYIPDHHLLEKDMTLCHPACFISAGCYKKYGVYNTGYHLAMDYEVLLRFKTSGVSFYHINRNFALMSDDGVSNINWRAAFEEVQRARSQYLQLGVRDSIEVGFARWRKSLGRKLERTPLKPAVAAYQRWFSLVRNK